LGVEVQRTIRTETTMIEAFNDFLDWVLPKGPIATTRPMVPNPALKPATMSQ
jgi:hypothetical protein